MRRILTSIGFFFSILLCGCVSDSYAPVIRLSVGPKKAPATYVVKRGDTLYSIAWTYGLDYRSLASNNRLSSRYQIWPGQRLSLKQRVSSRSQSELKKNYTVHLQHIRTVTHGWVWPTKGLIIQRFSPGFGGNAGVDIKGELGQKIVAAQAGKVVYSGDGVRGYGNLIIIEHSNDFLSAYAFNLKNLVRTGSWVHKGQQVAVMGRNSAGMAVLHFEIRQDGQPIDPLRYFR